MTVPTRGRSLEITDPVLLAFADEVGGQDAGPVTVVGGRTRWGVGGSVDASARELVAPVGIVDYVPDEMTVKVRAGTTVEELHAALAAEGQRTSLPERGGTIGGAIAVGHNCRDVLGRGRLRNDVLQVRYVSDDGRLVTGGGPTVKNVTGFDLPRLHTGALGTLGCLAEVILRTNPTPAVSRWLQSDDVDPFAVTATVLKPSAVLWDGEKTWVHLEGHGPGVAAEQQRLDGIGRFAAVDGPPPLPAHRWSLQPSDLADPARFGPEPWVASIGVGTAWASTPQPAPEVDLGLAALAERVKAQFDPTGRLNPGRQPGT
jgi:glycolate oxidase FAD binding subunit